MLSVVGKINALILVGRVHRVSKGLISKQGRGVYINTDDAKCCRK